MIARAHKGREGGLEPVEKGGGGWKRERDRLTGWYQMYHIKIQNGDQVQPVHEKMPMSSGMHQHTKLTKTNIEISKQDIFL